MHRLAPLFALAFAMTLAAVPAFAGGTPDGQTPAQETVCDGLAGALFGLCNAYCEAQDCDVHERPSCAQLRKNFAKHSGTTIFPCDVIACGDAKAPTCDGACPEGEQCLVTDELHAVCGCVSVATPCGDAAAPTCDGACPAGEDCLAASGIHPFCECVVH
jgi:hypothetical protein